MAKPKLALIPAAQGDKFYSVLPSDGVGDFTFTRASTGTRIAQTGLIESVASGKSRLNYDLLNGKVVNCPHYILEPSRTNLVPYSEDFSNSYWAKGNVSIASNSITSPDGTLNAHKVIENTTNANHYVDTSSISVTSGSSYTVSVFVKDNGRNLTIQGSASITASAFATFDLKNGFIITESVGNATIKNFGNNWYKCSLTFTAPATTSGTVTFLLGDTRSDVYQGDGTSGFYLWGAQLEQASYPTSYIPTTGTAITRAAESATDSGDAATFNDSEGVLMVDTTIKQLTTTNSISLTDGTANNLISIFANTSDTNSILFYLSFNGTAIVSSEAISINNIDEYNKISVKYKSGLTKIYINGFLRLSKSNSFSGASFDRLHLAQYNESPKFAGNVKQVQYFDSALADSQLETLTSWTSLQEMITSQLYTNY